MTIQYPSQDDVLRSEPLLRWIDEHFLRTDPRVFDGLGFKRLVSVISETLEVDPNGIYCIGSGAIGLSLNPGKCTTTDLKAFDETSDLDIAVISEVHFETAWRDLRKASAPTLSYMEENLEKHLSQQKRRLFDGAIMTDRLLPSLSFGGEWIEAIVKISETAVRILEREIETHIWIYRDYWSLRNYVAKGAIECRKKLI